MEIIEAAEGSPRFIKKFFGNVISILKKDEDNLRLILAETVRELRID